MLILKYLAYIVVFSSMSNFMKNNMISVKLINIKLQNKYYCLITLAIFENIYYIVVKKTKEKILCNGYSNI